MQAMWVSVLSPFTAVITSTKRFKESCSEMALSGAGLFLPSITKVKDGNLATDKDT